MHDDAHIGGRSENNIKCVVHDDLGWKNRTTQYILPHHGFTSGFLSFVDVELIRFFHGALELNFHSYCCNFVNNLFKKSCLLYSYLHLIIRLKKNEEIAYTAKSNVTIILLCCNVCIDVCLTHLMSIT